MKSPIDCLIVEDERTVRRVLVRIAEWIGLDCDAVGSASEAVRALAQKRYALVITDIKMPGASGLDVIRAASRGLDPPAVVAVSGFVTPEEEAEILGAGAVFLQKPFDAMRARTAIESALARE